MKVIFLKDVPRVGQKNNIKEVNDGYALNFLLPRKLAEKATAEAVRRLEIRQNEVRVEKEVQLELLKKNLAEIKGTEITITAKTDSTGHLFSGIHKKEIIDEMQKSHKITISEESIVLDKPIKLIGEYEIPIKINSQSSSFKLKILSV